MEHGCSRTSRRCLLAALILLSVCLSAPAQGRGPIDNPLGIPDARQILPTARDAEGVSATLQILVLLTVLTLVPSVLILTTSFTRILVVLALLRQAMGTSQLPPSQVMLGLALFMTLLIMGPTLQGIHADALTPYLNNEISQEVALNRAMGHLRTFMYRQIESAENYEDVYLFLEYQRGSPIPLDEKVTLDDVGSTVLIPAFVLSELKVAFVMGFRIYLPFLVIDMVIASILISMGMMMLPPVLVSLPFKILLFVLADGWHLVTQTLLMSFT
ncbi:MAG: flagellar type III secretion system pore protein FliP [Phycisphaerae bacterium]|nr:flagellar type III secretion system pore protein FliP [Phycisphaerae bacterium]